MTTDPLWDEAKAAPHGRDEQGVPLAPYGTNLDGSPRKSNRGARPGKRQGSGRGGRRGTRRSSSPGVKVGNTTDRHRKEALVGLTEMFVVLPMAGVSATPQLAERIGQRQSDAIAGDAVIISNYAPYIADGLIVLSQSKPGALAWLDRVEQKAPFLMLASIGIQMTRALVDNHLSPNMRLAAAGRLMGQIRTQEMADEILAEAERMGVPTPDQMAQQWEPGSEDMTPNGAEPTIPIHTAN